MGLWLGIMGEVYDVSAGQRHYGEAGLESARLGEMRLKGPWRAGRLTVAVQCNESDQYSDPLSALQGSMAATDSLLGVTPRVHSQQVLMEWF